MKRKSYVTTRDIVIPAGTTVQPHGPFRRMVALPQASILMAETKDITSEWAMDLAEAIEIGLVREKAEA